MKNYSGYIYGSENDNTWTQVFNKHRKYKFYNPLLQNNAHCSAIKDYLGVDDSYLSPVIVFSNNANIKNVNCDSEIYSLDSVASFLVGKEIDKNFISNEQKQEFLDKLSQCTLVDDTTKIEHVEQIKEKYYYRENGERTSSYVPQVVKNIIYLVLMIMIILDTIVGCSLQSSYKENSSNSNDIQSSDNASNTVTSNSNTSNSNSNESVTNEEAKTINITYIVKCSDKSYTIQKTSKPSNIYRDDKGKIILLSYEDYTWESEDYNYYCIKWYTNQANGGDCVKFNNRNSLLQDNITLYGNAESIYETVSLSSDANTFITGFKHTPNTKILYIPRNLEGKKSSIFTFAFENKLSSFTTIYIPKDCIRISSFQTSYDRLSKTVNIKYEGTPEDWNQAYIGNSFNDKVVIEYNCTYPISK